MDIFSRIIFNGVIWLILTVYLRTIQARTVTVDIPAGEIRIDGSVVQIIAGEIHYFRVPHQYWRNRLEKMRSAGLNTVATPVEWATHEPRPGEFQFTGDGDLEYFIQLAFEIGLYVILRCGPYIDADRNLGGLPGWLLHEYLSIEEPWLRTNHEVYKFYSKRWIERLLRLVKTYLYENGGPIILIQVEQDPDCQDAYFEESVTQFREGLSQDVILFTSVLDRDLKTCRPFIKFFYALRIENGFSKFLYQSLKDAYFEVFDKPVLIDVVSETATNWFDCKKTTDFRDFNTFVNRTLHDGVSLIYNTFVAGNNWGFSAACKSHGSVTLYDNGAPITVSGDERIQFYDFRRLTGASSDDSDIRMPKRKSFRKVIRFQAYACLLTARTKERLAMKPITAQYPKTYRELALTTGFILYETRIPFTYRQLSNLNYTFALSDIGYIYFRMKFVARVTKQTKKQIRLWKAENGDLIQILVENMGHANRGNEMSTKVKGFDQPMYLDELPLMNWTMYRYPFQDMKQLFRSAADMNVISSFTRSGAKLFRSRFTVDDTSVDYFLNMQDWHKGMVFLNGHNLGRYWPAAGPQVTIYVPGCYLRPYPEDNYIIILELMQPPETLQYSAELIQTPIFVNNRKCTSNHMIRIRTSIANQQALSDLLFVIYVILELCTGPLFPEF